MSDPKPALVALRDEREKTIQSLTDAFAADLFDVDEFESRVDKAHRASSSEALVALRRDIVPTSSSSEGQAMVAGRQEAIARAQPEKKWVVSILGAAERKGAWRVPKKLRVTALMGGTELDFREALLAPGVSEVKVFACMGGVDIIVPPGLAVECEGTGIMGAFESVDPLASTDEPSRPLLRISGAAFMGGVDISTRLLGESARDARKRKKRERRARRKALKSGRAPAELDGERHKQLKP